MLQLFFAILFLGLNSFAQSTCVAWNLPERELLNTLDARLRLMSQAYNQVAANMGHTGQKSYSIFTGKAGFRSCLQGNFDRVIIVAHTGKFGNIGFLYTSDDIENSKTYVPMTNLALRKISLSPSVKKIVVVACYWDELFDSYGRFDFWKNAGVEVVGVPELYPEKPGARNYLQATIEAFSIESN